MKKLVMLMIVAMVAATSNAAVINVNMYASSGPPENQVPEDPATLVGPAGGLGETWNQFNTTSGSGLLDSTGAATTVGFTNNVGSGWIWTSGGTPALTMLKGGRAHFGKGTDTTHTITGLTPGELYDVWIASYAHNSSPGELALGEWSTSNPTVTVGPQMIDCRTGLNADTWEYGRNFVRFEKVVANGSGEIVLLGDAADGTAEEPEYGETYSTRLPLSGWQIEPALGPVQPDPEDGETILTGNVDLSWKNEDPNSPGGDVYVDVWFGTEPNELNPNYDMTKVVTAGENTTTWTVSAPTEGTYYWQVVNYIYGPDHINEPNAIVGSLWSFYALDDTPPSLVDAGVDMITWSGEPVSLDATVVDDGISALTYLWTADPADGVVFDPSAAVEDPTVTITKATANPSTVTLTLAVNDESNPPVEDTMEIDVYDGSCQMARIALGLSDITDFDNNCITDLKDFGVLAAKWLYDYSATGPEPR